MLLASCRVTLRLVDHRLLPLAVVQSTCRHCSHSALGCGTCLSRSIRSNSQHVCGHINGSTSRVGLIQRHFTGPLPDDVSKEVSFQKENIWTIPNLLSLSRLASSPVLGYFILTEKHAWAFGLFVIAGITDLVDGVIARRFPSQSSMFGSVLDPFADKCMIAVLTVALAISNLLPLPLVVLILGRDFLLVLASFYLRYTTLPPPRTFSRFWDIQRSTLQVTPNMIGKVNTFLQLALLGMTVAAPVIGFVDHPALQFLWYAVGCTTVASGVSYLTQLKGFRLNLKKTHSATSISSQRTGSVHRQ